MAVSTLRYMAGAETGGLEEWETVSGTVGTVSTGLRTSTASAYAYSFTGSAYLSQSNAINGGTGYSVSAVMWFFFATSETGTVNFGQYNDTTDTWDGTHLVLDPSDGSIDLYNGNNTLVTSSSTSSFSTNTWHHLEFIYEAGNGVSPGNEAEVYIDGSSVLSTTSNAANKVAAVLRIETFSVGTAGFKCDCIASGFNTNPYSSAVAIGQAEIPPPYGTSATTTRDWGGTPEPTGNWSNISDVPANDSTVVSLDDSGPVIPGNGVYCDDTGGVDGGGGPSGDSLGTIIGCSYTLRARRSNGGSPSSYGLTYGWDTAGTGDPMSNDYTASALTFGSSVSTVSKNYYSASAAQCPSSTGTFGGGLYHSLNGGRDIFLAEYWPQILHVPSTAGAYELEAGAGSYTYTGSAADLDRSAELDAADGSFSVTGSAANFYKGVSFSAEAGSYSLTGANNAFQRGYVLSANQGVYFATAPANSDFLRGLVHLAESGSYSYTGADANFTYTQDITLSAEAGSYSVTGENANTLAARYLGTYETTVVGLNDYGPSATGDTQKVWTNDANAVDNSTGTFASTSTEGSFSNNALRLTGCSFAIGDPLKHVLSAEIRVYCQATGTGTPRLGLNVYSNDSDQFFGDSELLDTTFDQTTAGWTNWTAMSEPANGWGTISDIADRLFMYAWGQDDTGTLTEARVYKVEIRYTWTYAAYSIRQQDGVLQPDLLVARALPAEDGAYSVSGSAADLDFGYSLQAESGAYSSSGSSAGVYWEHHLDANAGAYTYTGSSANLNFEFEGALAAATGTYAYTGSDASLNVGVVLNVDAGSYALTGSPSVRQITFDNDSGSLTITGAESARHITKVHGGHVYFYVGSDVDFSLGAALSAESGSYSTTGADANFKYSNLAAASGSYSLTGADAALTFVSANGLSAESGAFSVAGSNAEFLRDYVLTCDSGTYSHTGSIAALLYSAGVPPLLAEGGSYVVSGADTEYTAQKYLGAGSGTYNSTGASATLRSAKSLEAGAYQVTGEVALFYVNSSRTRRAIIIG